MAEHVWSVLCARWVENPTTHNITLFEVIEDIEVPRPQQGSPVMVRAGWTLVSVYRRTDRAAAEDFEQRIEVAGPSGKVAMGPLVHTVSLGAAVRARCVTKIDALEVREEGTHTFRVAHRPSNAEWIQNASVLLEVSFEKKE